MIISKLARSFAALLTQSELSSLSEKFPTWTVHGNSSISKTFVFKNFKEAWEFMQLVAKVADQQDHHPDWKNVYNRVEVNLNTHSAGGITKQDTRLAKFMDSAELLVKQGHEDD